MNVYIRYLGCPKNDIDAETMLYVLQQAGYQNTRDPAQAHIIIINTCGFIHDAKVESVDAILELAQYKQTGQCRLLVAAGCLTKRYSAELYEQIPEVDLFLGVAQYGIIDKLIAATLDTGRMSVTGATPEGMAMPGRLRITSPGHYAYIKIAEGCDNRCTYCAIPSIRGPYISRPEPDIVREAGELAAQGVKELIVVAQDTTRYGIDLCGTPQLVPLLKQLVAIPQLERIRLLYCYPEMVTDELLTFIAEQPRMCKYLDIPLQHIDDGVLKRMNRRTDERSIRTLVAKARSLHIALRTTFIIGFPGETEEQFAKLLRFVQEGHFDNMGAFTYSPEEGTPAYRLQPRVSERVARRRRHELMMAQQQVSERLLAQHIGQTLPVLIDSVQDDGQCVARTDFQAPQIDGNLYCTAADARPGDRIAVRVTRSTEYDLWGEPV